VPPPPGAVPRGPTTLCSLTGEWTSLFDQVLIQHFKNKKCKGFFHNHIRLQRISRLRVRSGYMAVRLPPGPATTYSYYQRDVPLPWPHYILIGDLPKMAFFPLRLVLTPPPFVCSGYMAVRLPPGPATTGLCYLFYYQRDVPITRGSNVLRNYKSSRDAFVRVVIPTSKPVVMMMNTLLW
jgi:hypothetical protein